MIDIFVGDCREVLRTLPDESIHCCVTSPPYFGLRDYGVDGQIGLEPSVGTYVEEMVSVAREIHRVLRPDGTFWLNLGDSYSRSGKGGSPGTSKNIKQKTNVGSLSTRGRVQNTRLVAKQLFGVPWRVALALQDDGWLLRQDIVWHKPNPMPESVRDRCTRAHEFIFMFSKNAKYYYDSEAIMEPRSQGEQRPTFRGGAYCNNSTHDNSNGGKSTVVGNVRVDKQRGHSRRHAGFNDRWDAMGRDEQCFGSRNKRDVWTVATSGFSGAHFATFPAALIKPCVLAGCPAGGVVLDPFFGAGTTGVVAKQNGRSAIGIELNPTYAEMARARIEATAFPRPTALQIDLLAWALAA